MSQKPNLLFIHVDQQRYDSLGFTGHSLVKTPHLDKLRREGMSFGNAFTPIPLCCPARQTLLSGVMPEVHGGLWNYDSQLIPGLTNEFPTWTESLKEANFNMAYFGKWHVSPTLDPTAFGYDIFEPETWTPPEQRRQQYEMPENRVWAHTGQVSKQPVADSPTHQLAAKAIETIKSYNQESTPWHVRLDFSEPHLPCWPSEPFASMYKPEEITEWDNFKEEFINKPYIQQQQLANWEIEDWTWDEWAKYLTTYFGIISQYDDAIGNVLNTLDDLGIADNTIVIYTTDHGDAAGSHRMIDKHYVMYEEEVRVPMLIRWPGVIIDNSSCDDFVMNCLDLGPTILDMYDLEIPESFQGKSFFKQLKGQPNSDIWPFAFSTYHGQQFGLYDMRMIRDERYKYIYNPTDVDEFYDLENDPAELSNFAGSEMDQKLGTEYRKKVFETFAALGDRLMTQGPWVANWLS